jgi:NAD(P)H-flavin reductase
MKISKETLGLAGEYAVASELCKRGIYTQLTLGNRKKTDLLIEDDRRMLRIQVKSKQDQEWPAVKGILGDDVALVFVDFQNKDLHERPDFYVMISDDWANFIKVNLIDTGLVERKMVTIDKFNMPTYKGGFKGTGIKVKQIEKYKEKWNKIESLKNPKS